MGLTDLFNKWIVEHGSAIVQEKQIAFFRDQLVAADKKAVLLESENAGLKTKIENLESDLETSIKENEELRSKIQEYEHIDEDNFKKTECEPLDPEAGY
jgi:hypothetical protein